MALFSASLRRHFSSGWRTSVGLCHAFTLITRFGYGAGRRQKWIGKDAAYPRKVRAQDLGRRNADPSSFRKARQIPRGLVLIESTRFAPTPNGETRAKSLVGTSSGKYAWRRPSGRRAFCFPRDIALQQIPTAVPTSTTCVYSGSVLRCSSQIDLL